MRPAWSVILLTTLIGAGQGLFLAVFASGWFWSVSTNFVLSATAISLLFCGAGLTASFFHLGHPERAWRSAAMWRTSWLSREVIVLPVFMLLAAGYAALYRAGLAQEALLVGWVAVAACTALFICTGMIYACLRFLQEWHTPLSVLNYTALGCASGLTAAAALAALLEPALARPYTAAALVLGAAAYLLRLAALLRNARLRPKSSPASAIGVKHPRIVQIAQGAMGGSFNTREFFHGRPREVVRAARWALLALVLPAPALPLIFSGGSATALLAAFVLQYTGLLAERWYFFAEARHPQNLYYRAIA